MIEMQPTSIMRFDAFAGQAFLRPRRTLLFSASAAFKTYGGSDESPPSCEKNITDVELQALLTELDGVETLSKSTLFCAKCGERLVIEKKQHGVRYCTCKDSGNATESSDGWIPYMEAEDVVIWRKEYKPGQGLYAYKVYGRYSELRASDFAAIQVDGGYRRVWDTAVASLAVVEQSANGLDDQSVLHWEVLWPRLFANRDYVYIRRHKEYDVKGKCLPHKDSIFRPTKCEIKVSTERPSVHSNAKRKSMEAYERNREGDSKDKVYIIVSRSCEHPDVPETKSAIRVTEYWSHMVVKTLDGEEKSGMEFVLTYYDEPAVGGMPSSVAAWASGRAAPAYLQRMRAAAAHYRAWRHAHHQDTPDFKPFATSPMPTSNEQNVGTPVREEDMESSNLGPVIEDPEVATRDQATQTDSDYPETNIKPKLKVEVTHVAEVKVDKCVAPGTLTREVKMEPPPPSEVEEKTEDEEIANTNGSWWRYLYPFYYFV